MSTSILVTNVKDKISERQRGHLIVRDAFGPILLRISCHFFHSHGGILIFDQLVRVVQASEKVFITLSSFKNIIRIYIYVQIMFKTVMMNEHSARGRDYFPA